MKHALQHNNTQRDFVVKKQSNQIVVTDEDGNKHQVELIQRNAHTLIIAVNDTRINVSGAKVGDQKHVWVNGRHFRFEPVVAGAAAASADPGALSVSIPAVVTEVLVQPGDTVKTGDKLVLLESMKMVLSIQAPHNGKVKAVHCEAAQSVEPGVVLVELSSDD